MSNKATTPFDLSTSTADFVNVAVSGTSAVTASVVNATKVAIFNPLRVASAADIVYVAFGTAPTATTASFPLVEGINIFNFNPTWKVAAISGGTATTVSVLVVSNQ